jgi:hypothetical protein
VRNASEVVEFEVGAAVTNKLTVQAAHDMDIYLKIENAALLAARQKVATLHFSAADSINATLSATCEDINGTSSTGPWYATADSTDPLVLDVFTTTYTAHENFYCRYVKRALGSTGTAWEEITGRLSATSGQQYVRNWNIDDFDINKTGIGYEIGLEIFPLSGPSYCVPFAWSDGKTNIARYLPKPLTFALNEQSRSLTDGLKSKGLTEIELKATCTNTYSSAPSNASWSITGGTCGD